MRPVALLGSCLPLVLVVGAATPAAAQSTVRVSVTSAGAEVTGGNSETPSLSRTGRYIAFMSQAPLLVPEDANTVDDVFVRDRYTSAMQRVSVSSAGVAGNGDSDFPVLSADGRIVAFRSGSSNLDPADTDPTQDIYVRDRLLGTTVLVSKSSAGVATPFGASSSPAISADGRYVAFESDSTMLVPDDTNSQTDIFVHDRQFGITTRVNLMHVPPAPPQLNQAVGNCFDPSISSDGNRVAFAGEAINLVPGDVNGKRDVFVRDRLAGTTTLVSRSSAGVQGDGHSGVPVISADGRYVAFESSATNLVAGDTNGAADIFVHDLVTGVTERVSVSSSGVQGSSFSREADISEDGRLVTFYSSASNLVAGDTNSTWDVLRHDRQTGVTTRVSLATGGAQANGGSWLPAISGDGNFIAFQSAATNLEAAVDANDREDVFFFDAVGCAGPGAWIGYGAGLQGAGGKVPGLFGSSCPLPGAVVTLHLDEVVGAAQSALFFGLSSASLPFKGGTFHVGAVGIVVNFTLGGTPGVAGAGTLDLPLALPVDPLVSGLSLFMQGAFLDAAAPHGISLTQGLQMTLG